MIQLRDFALFVLPGLVAAGGWLYALGLRQRVRPMLTPREKVERGSSPDRALATSRSLRRRGGGSRRHDAA